MSFEITIQWPSQPPLNYPLADGRVRLGRAAACEIQVDFEEIPDVAAELEVRGEAVFLTNRNPFPIFVGEQSLAPGETVAWSPDQPVQLTLNATMSLIDRDVEPLLGDEVVLDPNRRMRSTVQLAVIGVCAVLGVMMLSAEPKTKKSAVALPFTLEDLVSEMEDAARDNQGAVDFRKLTYEQQTILGYLVEAGRLDFRWGEADPKKPIVAYELLINYRPIRTADPLADALQSRIKRYANVRLDELSENVK